MTDPPGWEQIRNILGMLPKYAAGMSISEPSTTVPSAPLTGASFPPYTPMGNLGDSAWHGLSETLAQPMQRPPAAGILDITFLNPDIRAELLSWCHRAPRPPRDVGRRQPHKDFGSSNGNDFVHYSMFNVRRAGLKAPQGSNCIRPRSSQIYRRR